MFQNPDVSKRAVIRELIIVILLLFFLYFADRASQYIYLNINQSDVLNFIMSLFHASTCFERGPR